MSTQRARRVESLIVREVSEILLCEVKDPRVVGVTVTGAKVSADLSHAVIFYQAHGVGADLEAIAAGLESVKGIVKKLIGKRIRLKFLPDIRFQYDPSLEYGERIEQLLKQALSTSKEEDNA